MGPYNVVNGRLIGPTEVDVRGVHAEVERDRLNAAYAAGLARAAKVVEAVRALSKTMRRPWEDASVPLKALRSALAAYEGGAK